MDKLELVYTILIVVTIGYFVFIIADTYYFDVAEKPYWVEDCVFTYYGKVEGYDVYLFSGCKPKSLLSDVISYTVKDEYNTVIYIESGLDKKTFEKALRVELCNAKHISENAWKNVIYDLYCNIRYGMV